MTVKGSNQMANRTSSIDAMDVIFPDIVDDADNSARLVTKKTSGLGFNTSHLNSGVMTQLGSSYGIAR